MNAKQYIINQFSQVFTKEQLSRLKILLRKDQVEVTVDVHGLHKNSAKIFLNNLINCSRIAFTLIVIHGYCLGSVLKDMLATEFDNPHVTDRHPLSHNPGVTKMTICGYCA